jgi:hypothetical protein
LRLLAQVYELTWYPLGVWHDDALLGIFPLLSRRLGPFHLAGSPLMQVIASTPFLGPVVAPQQLPATLAALNDLLYNWKIDHVEIGFPMLLADVTPTVQLGYATETCQTVVVPLAERTGNQLWCGLSSACQRAVRKAEASGVDVVEAQDIRTLDEYYCMCEEVYRDAGRPPHLSRQFYLAAWQALMNQGNMKVLFAEYAGVTVAGAIFLLYRDTAYYLSGASHDQSLHLRPNNLIQWHFMRWAAAQGYRWYDLGGATVPGITRFKLSFGGKLVYYTRMYRTTSTVARIGRIVYQHAIPLWRRWQAAAQKR